jgi:hypothetical protein
LVPMAPPVLEPREPWLACRTPHRMPPCPPASWQIPTEFVEEVRLPEPKYEEDDFELLSGDDWGALFTDGKVPDVLDCEHAMAGLATLGDGVRMVEPEYYEAPSQDMLDENGELLLGGVDGEEEEEEEDLGDDEE